MRKLKHVQTSIAEGEEYFLICVDQFAILDSWNHFPTLEQAEAELFRRFSPNKTKKYTIVQCKVSRILYTYK